MGEKCTVILLTEQQGALPLTEGNQSAALAPSIPGVPPFSVTLSGAVLLIRAYVAVVGN